MGKIPFDELDVLVVGEIGKNYSGAGIDPNVVGRLLIEAAPGTGDEQAEDHAHVLPRPVAGEPRQRAPASASPT